MGYFVGRALADMGGCLGCGCMRPNGFSGTCVCALATFNAGLPSMPVHAFLARYFIFLLLIVLSFSSKRSLGYVSSILYFRSSTKVESQLSMVLHMPLSERTRNLRLLSPLSLSLSSPPSFVLSDCFRYSTFHASRPPTMHSLSM